LLGRDRRYLFANPPYFRILGLGGDLAGKGRAEVPLDVYHDQNSPRLDLAFAGKRIEYELIKPNDTGLAHYYTVQLEPLRSPDGEVSSVIAVIHDITRPKLAELRLRESEERLRLAQEAAHAGIWEWMADDDRNIWSNSLWDLYGLTPSQCEPSFESWALSIHPDDRAQATATVRAAAAAGREFEIQWRVNLPDGEPVRWLLSRGRPVAAADGAPERYIGIVMDVTARKQAVAELERMRFILAEGQRIAHLGSFEYIAATQETVWSDEEKRIYGLDPAGLSPVYEEMLRHHIHPDDAAELDRGFRKALQNGAVFENENRIVRPDGAIRWIYNCAHPYFDSAGKLIKYIGATLDITERRKREEQVQLLLREVSHRAKNMLGVVQAIASQTASAQPGDFITRFSERIQALAANLDLLVKSRWQGVGLKDLVRSQLAHFEGLIGRRIEIEGPPLHIAAEAAQPIAMALHELATNAGKYGALSSREGHVSIAWRIGGDGSFHLGWTETGGPPVVPPERRGFGSTVIALVPEMQLDAAVTLEYPPGGVRWRLTCPAKRILEQRETGIGGEVPA
jgi:PAS domain S-box-containing protein